MRASLDEGRRALDELTLDLAASEGIAGVAAQAANHLEDAAQRADGSVPLTVLRQLPVVREQVDGIRRMTGVTDNLGASALQAATRIDQQLEHAGEAAGRIELLDVALEEIDRIEAELASVDLGSPRGLTGPLQGAHDDLVESITDARGKLRDAEELVEPVREMLVGPSTYLLLAANNAEMAGGAGLALSAGQLKFVGGEIELGDVVPARRLRLEQSVPDPGDLGQIYRPTGVGIDFRSTTRSPDFPAMARLAADMVEAGTGEVVDGVVVVDAVALTALLEVTGPVEVEGQAIDADNVLAEVLNENYKRFAGDPRAERDSYQGDIAKAIFDAVTERDVEAAPLANGLVAASEGRHLMLWSADEALQDVWEELGVTGELTRHGLLISFQNYAANKLDWYLRPEASLASRLTAEGDYRLTLTMTVDMPALEELEGATPYILGPNPERQGLFLTVHLPASATDITTPDPPGFRTKGRDGPLQARTFLVDVPLGTTFQRTVEFTVPREQGALILLPSARVEPLPLTIEGVATIDDDVPTVFTWPAAVAALPADETDVELPVRALVTLGLVFTLGAAGSLSVLLMARRRGHPSSAWARASQLGAGAALAAFVLAGLVAALLSVPRV